MREDNDHDELPAERASSREPLRDDGARKCESDPSAHDDEKDADEDEDEDDGKDEDPRGAREKFPDWSRSPRHRLILLIAAIAMVAAVVAGILWWLEARRWVTTENAYVRGPVARLSPGVAGNVSQVFVQDNQLVVAGQPLAAIAISRFDVALRQGEAELASAKAQLLQARAAVAAARAQVGQSAATARARDADADRAAREYRRYRSLSEGAVAEQQRDRARAEAQVAAENATAADETTRAARARIGQAEADVAAAEARVQQAEATLANARLQRGDAVVVAPIGGRVTQFDIEPGDYIAPGQPLAAIVGSARWVEANFKEDQLRLMRVGQHVEVRIGTWDDHVVHAYVDSFQAGSGAQFSALPPQNATANWVKTVQRIPVKLRFRPDAFRAFPARADVVPGLSVEASVKVMP